MGDELFGEVTDATGLPTDLVSNELESLLNQAGIRREEMTIEDLRKVLANYVQDVLLAAKEEFAKSNS